MRLRKYKGKIPCCLKTEHDVRGQHHVQKFIDKDEDYHIVQCQKNECLFIRVIFLYHFVRMRVLLKELLPSSVLTRAKVRSATIFPTL